MMLETKLALLIIFTFVISVAILVGSALVNVSDSFGGLF